jgi:hypothetical protein
VATEAGWDAAQPADWDDYCMRFPVSLQPFCYRDARSYLKILDSQTLAGTGEDENEEDRFLVRQPEVEVETLSSSSASAAASTASWLASCRPARRSMLPPRARSSALLDTRISPRASTRSVCRSCTATSSL